MVRVKHLRDRTSKYVFSRTWTFPEGERVIDIPVPEAFDMVDLHRDLELVADPPIPRDADELAAIAAASDDTDCDAESDIDAIASWLDELDADARAAALDYEAGDAGDADGDDGDSPTSEDEE